jgi:hypothetical protein
MVFQSPLAYTTGESAPAWATMSTLLREIGAMRELYRGGDPTGMAVAVNGTPGAPGAPVPDVIVEATLHPRALVLTLINVAAVNDTANDLCCALGVSACHFTFVPTSIPLLAVWLPPGGFDVVDSFEVFNATVLPGALPLLTDPLPADGGTSVGLSGVALGTGGPGSGPGVGAPEQAIVRTLVLATDGALRGEVAAALAKGRSV